MRKGKISWGIAFLMVFLFACAPAPQPDHITVQLKWVHQAHFAGFYAAQEMGFFQDENLVVELIEGGPGIDQIASVTSGKADYAVVAPNVLFREVERGQELKAIATIFQISPTVFVSLADSGISRPQDFIGKRIAIQGIPDFEAEMHAMLDFLGIDWDTLILKEHSYSTDLLTSGAVDVQGFYITSGLQRLLNQGFQANLIYPGDYGVHLNSDCIIAADSTLQEHPDLTLRFLRALLRGFTYAIENEEEALQIIMQYALESDLELQRNMWKASIPLISTGVHPVGALDTRKWQAMHDMLLDQGTIKQPIPLEQVLDASFMERIIAE
jgi:NitT/TauT family transport system substrate-binding protein